MIVCWHSEAEAELNRTIAYYEARQLGLGLEFSEEVYAAVDRILGYPEAWTSIRPNTRRALLNRFPFAVIYQIKPDLLNILAVADLRRLPEYWKGRT
jgi:hypothetical protein